MFVTYIHDVSKIARGIFMKVTGVFVWTEDDNNPPCTVWVRGVPHGNFPFGTWW